MTLIRLLYNLAYPLALIVMLPWLVQRMIRRGKYRHKFGQRFAIYSPRVRTRLAEGGRTWVHAVSVGEVLIAMKLIRRLRERDPGRTFVLSTTTSTGFALANEQRTEWLEPIYNPLDFFLFTRRALALIRPTHVVLVEAEVWPNLVCQARARGIPVTLVNARLSPRSERRFRAVRAITGPLFNQLSHLCVQDEPDLARWRSLGVSPSRIVLTGSIKFDEAHGAGREPRDFRPLLSALGVPADAPILLGASTHPGEEAELGRALLRLRERFPRIFLLSVPRHFERAPQARADLEGLGLRVALRSEIAEQAAGSPPDVLLVNTTGELRDWTRCADVVFVGKSLLHRGGQNPAEAVAAGKPVLFGPHMENFAVLVEGFLREGGAIVAADAGEIATRVGTLLDDPAAGAAMAARGQRVLAGHHGATDRTCDVIEDRRPAARG